MTKVDSIPRTPKRTPDVTLRTDLDFVTSHSAHGPLVGTIARHPVNGYRHRIACACGATFHRYSTARGGHAVLRHKDPSPVVSADRALDELVSV